jgi:hypothetical protein
MSVTTVDPAIAKILTAITRNGGAATITDIKRKIAEFNQAGGVEKLRQYLADLVSKGYLTLQTSKGDRGHDIETYSLAKSKVISGNKTNCNTASTANLTIAVTLDTTLEDLLQLVHSLISIEDGNGKVNDDPVEDIPAPPTPTVPQQRISRFTTKPGKPMPPRFGQSAPPPCDDAPDDDAGFDDDFPF